MNILDMEKDDFEEVPEIDYKDLLVQKNIGSIVLIPTGDIHDSGFKVIKYVLVSDEGEPIGVYSGCSDALHLDGIGGYGYNWHKENDSKVPTAIKPQAWRIDCLPCGYMRVFARRNLIFRCECSEAEVFAKGKDEYF